MAMTPADPESGTAQYSWLAWKPSLSPGMLWLMFRTLSMWRLLCIVLPSMCRNLHCFTPQNNSGILLHFCCHATFSTAVVYSQNQEYILNITQYTYTNKTLVTSPNEYYW